MASFKVKIEDLTGAVGDDSALSDWLTAGASEIIKILPPDMIELASTTSDLDSSPNTLAMDSSTIGDIISVIRNDGTQYQICRKIPGFLSSRATISTDIMYATASDPVYYIKSSTLYIYPLPTDTYGAEVTHVHYPSVAHGDSTIDDFPNGCEYLVVLYASCKALQRLMNDKSSSLPSDVSEPVLSTTSISLPSYISPPPFLLPVLPSGVDVDFSEVGNVLNFISPTFSIPSLSSISSMNMPSIPIAPSMSEKNVTITGTAPTFIAPTMGSLDFDDTENWISIEEDSEMLQARATEIQVKIAEYSALVASAEKSFNKEQVEYQAKLQKDLQDAQLSESKEGRDLQKYTQELQSYQAEVNKEIQRWVNEEFNQKFNKWTQEYQGQLGAYGSDIQNETAKIGASLNDYQAKVQKALTSYQAETGYDISRYTSEVQANVQKFNSDLQDNSTDFMNNLQKYQAEIGNVTEENQSKLGKYAQDLANYGAKIQKHSMDYQWMQGQRELLMRDYNQGIQMLIGGGKPIPPQKQREGDR